MEFAVTRLEPRLNIELERIAQCQYGENRWQTPAGFYRDLRGVLDDPLGLDKLVAVEGQTPSYNNYIDIHRMLQTMTHIAAAFKHNLERVPGIAIGVKHGNCCGAAVGGPLRATARMVEGSPMSLFGGLVMTNFRITEDVAGIIRSHKIKDGDPKRVLDGIVAPGFDAAAVHELTRKGDKCRMLALPALATEAVTKLDLVPIVRPVRGGFLVQPNYTQVIDFKMPTMVKLGDLNLSDAALGWGICSTSNSNTITLVSNEMLIGNGNGQDARDLAAALALLKADRSGHNPFGALAVSDSFFPFTDGPQILVRAGVGSVLTTYGSKNDKQVEAYFVAHNTSLWWMPDAQGRMFFGH